MGVKGLESFVKKSMGGGAEKTDIWLQLRGKVLIVDLPSLEFYMMDKCVDGPFPGISDDLVDEFVSKIKEFCQQLKNLGIFQIWVEDVSSPSYSIVLIVRYLNTSLSYSLPSCLRRVA